VGLSEAKLLEDMRRRFFSPLHSRAPHTIGIEVEFIPIHAATHLPALPRSKDSPSTAQILSSLGAAEGWSEQSFGDDPPSWKVHGVAEISFEPGGQIEIGSTPQPTATAVIQSTRALISRIRTVMSDAGIELLAKGVDPFNDIGAVSLQLHRDRYVRMTRLFETIGPCGARMMRQTAAIQINVERGPTPLVRWRLLNALAPYIVALFANSRQYSGSDSGHASYRAHLWRCLDPSRTGLPYDDRDAAQRYLDFALDAKALGSSDGSRQWQSFRDWMRDASPTEADWTFHLSTLFPEIRPKEFFEIRSADAIDSEWLAAPVVFITGLVYDEASAFSAMDLIGDPSEVLLERAGRSGLADPQIHSIMLRLTQLARNGAKRLGEHYISTADIATASEYFARALAGQSLPS
jgi:glutamate--cysteine ligase